MTDVFINHSVESFIKIEIKKQFKKEKLEYLDNQNIKLNRNPFLMEISSH